MASQSYTLSAVGSTPPVPITPDILSGRVIAPGIICSVSAGGALTYSVEVTGDPVAANGFVALPTNWVAMDSMAGLTASALATLGGCVTGIRARISAYTSGSLVMSVVWTYPL